MSRKVVEQSLMYQAYVDAKDTIVKMVSRLVPPKEIEDIVQETYVRICQVEHPNEIQQPRSFLMRTAKNLALDHLKRAETRLSEELSEEWDLIGQDTETNDDIFEQAASCQEFARFCKAVRQLPQQCRKVFVLKKVYGYSQKEIALELKISENTVEKHISTGFKRCAEYMSQFDPELLNQLPKKKNTSVREVQL